MQHDPRGLFPRLAEKPLQHVNDELHRRVIVVQQEHLVHRRLLRLRPGLGDHADLGPPAPVTSIPFAHALDTRSEEHTSELQSLMSITYAVFCLQKTNTRPTPT